jgi:protein TonB
MSAATIACPISAEGRLALALVLSVALHAAAWHLLPPIGAQVAPLQRTLEVLLVPQPEAPAAAPLPVPAQPRPAAPIPRAAPPRPRMESHADPIPSPPLDPGPAASPEPVRPAGPPAPVATSVPASPPPVARAPATDLLAGYGNSISRLLAHHREYPRVALMRGWEGTVTMRLRVAPGGKLIEANVEGSSGHATLDAQALEMVKRVAELPPPPEGLREREFAVLVPVVFRLQR